MSDGNILQQPNSWLSQSLSAQKNTDKGNYAVYAVAPVQKNDLLAVWGGTVVTRAQLDAIAASLRQLSVQIENDLYLVTTVAGPGDYINHSCDPNAGLVGQTGLVAMRNISPGEEICFDYAMSDSSNYDEFDCACGAANCRGRITGNDWRNPDLWVRYQGYFSPYLQKRIEQL